MVHLCLIRHCLLFAMSVTTVAPRAPILLSNLLHHTFPLLSRPSFSTRPLLLQPCPQCPLQRHAAGKPLANKLHMTCLCSLPLRLMWFCRQRWAHWHRRCAASGWHTSTNSEGRGRCLRIRRRRTGCCCSINACSLEGQARKKIAGLLGQY